MGESDVAAFNRHGADFQLPSSICVIRVARLLRRSITARWSVTAKMLLTSVRPFTVRINLLVPAFQTPPQFLLSSSSLFAGQRDHVLKGQMLEMSATLSEISTISPYCWRVTGHIFVLNLVTCRSHALVHAVVAVAKEGMGGERKLAVSARFCGMGLKSGRTSLKAGQGWAWASISLTAQFAVRWEM